MKFQISKESLLKIMANVNGAVEKKNTIPILLNVKIEAIAGKLNLTTTDMDIVVSAVSEDATIIEEGQTTMPAQLLYDIVRKIPEGVIVNITLQEDQNSALLEYDRSKFTLPCLDPVEFPVLSEGEMEHDFIISAKELSRIIDKSRFAISSDETRYYLNGLFLYVAKNIDSQLELRAVATDGHRLALSSFASDNFKEEVSGIIIPKKTVNEIRRIIEEEESVKVLLSKSKIQVKCKNCHIISKLIDGQFPDYNQVVPKNNDKVIAIAKKTIFDAIDRVATIANDKHRTIKLVLESGKILLQVSSSDGGFANEEVEVDFSGDKVEAGFNSRYLLEIINQIDGDELHLKFNDSFSPVIVDADGFSGLYVIMPVRV